MGWSVFWIGDFVLPKGLRPLEDKPPFLVDNGVIWERYDGGTLRVRRIVDHGDDDDGGYRRLLDEVTKAGGRGALSSIAWEDGPDSFGFAYDAGTKEPRKLTKAAIAKLFEANAEAMSEAIARAMDSGKPPAAAAKRDPTTSDVMEFKKRPPHFDVAYRASAEPQILQIDVVLNSRHSAGAPEANLRQAIRHMGMGVTGGSEFAPSQSTAKHRSGPIDPSKARDDTDTYRWKIEVAGVSPKYLRHLVSQIQWMGGGSKAMTIRGTLPVDEGPLSVTTEIMDRWMTSRSAWASAYPTIPFAITEVERASGCKVAVETASPPSKGAQDALFQHLREFAAAVYGMPATTDDPLLVRIGGAPKMGMTKKKINAEFQAYALTGKGPRDQLVNFLIRFHETIAPLTSVELGFPPDPE